MSIKNKIIERFLGSTIEREVSKRLKASSLMSPTVEEMQWRRLTADVQRELMPATQDRMIEIAYWLYETNALAGWLIDITSAFILAEGLPYETEDDDLRELLDSFWSDPVNRMDLYLPKHVTELRIFGELCLPAFTAEQTGRVRLGYVDPARIEAIITDPQNVKMQIGVLTKAYATDIGGFHIEADPKKYKIILPEEAEFVLSPAARQLQAQMTDGDCFFFSINNVTNSPRGRSDLLSVADWLDAYEQFLFDYAERWPQLSAFLWDLKVEGGDQKAIKEQVDTVPKKPGSVFGHNEKVTLTPAAPDLNSVEVETGARVFRNHIMGRFGYPEHWYGSGEAATIERAGDMNLVAIKMLSNKQNHVKYILETILGYQVSQARRAGYLRKSDATFSVITPMMQVKDISKYGSAVQQVATGLQVAEAQEWIDKDTARKIFSAIMDFVGVEIDLDEVKEAIEKQGETKGYEDYVRKAQFAKTAENPAKAAENVAAGRKGVKAAEPISLRR